MGALVDHLLAVMAKSGALSAADVREVFAGALAAINASSAEKNVMGTPVHTFMVTRLVDMASEHGIELRQ